MPAANRRQSLIKYTLLQDGKCAICEDIDVVLVCDHDHNHQYCEPGWYGHRCDRGAVCPGCNVSIGWVERWLVKKVDNPKQRKPRRLDEKKFERIIAYLKAYHEREERYRAR